MTFQRIPPVPSPYYTMPKQDETINLFDPDTGTSMQVPISFTSTVDAANISQETAAAIQKQIELKTVVGQTPTGSALKFDDGKLPFHLLSTEAMNQTAAVLAFGAEKYAEHNWRKGFVWSRPLSAAMRHITAFNAGEDKDPESGLSHLAHAACCIMFLLEFEKTHKELDDRYKP